ncbi:MAG: endopeptidase La [Acidobacteria bacterium]|nr:endopeptidase La [Acidobacteriota bacterium]MBI3656911.1 endopeptidase La [Acidobacteriota bacterium]
MADELITSGTVRLPMVPIRDVVVFPYMMIPFVIGRAMSIRALEQALATDKRIFLATQIDATVDDPEPEDIYTAGTVANIVQSLKLPDGNIRVLVEGLNRAKVTRIEKTGGFLTGTIDLKQPKPASPAKLTLFSKRITSLLDQLAKLNPGPNYDDFLAAVKSADPDHPERQADIIASKFPGSITVEQKQSILEIFDQTERLNKICEIIELEIEKIKVDRTIQGRVRRQMEKAQREYYLNEKIKAIQKELGKKDEKTELEELRKKVQAAKMPKDAHDKAMKEIERLEMMPPMSAESTVSRTYIDWLIAIPWAKKTREIRDINHAAVILEEDHYGLDKIKERILEFLVIRQLVKKPKGSILCFVGPPGVGKTSLGRSIARATGREFVRLSLGGVRDEAEIRGHRRTYIGALPGQIIQMLKKAGTRNPVFMLDEIDKMSVDFRGDPSAALMEVLDPEQNNNFMDHYLDTGVDLSSVMFVCTANVLYSVPRPLQDRMEVISLAGYTELEKLQIAKRFLVKKQIGECGINPKQLSFDDEAILALIRRYTREAGVRNLEREIANVCRKVARKIVSTKTEEILRIAEPSVEEYLGVAKFREKASISANEVGLATGLAWTEVGGEVLHTEATLMDGKGSLTLTGKLGEVMQESAQAALSYVRSRAGEFGIGRDFYRRLDFHIHVPEGAIPKDGPSAGITMATSLISILTRIPVRSDVAMTGEITLRGKVLPIGGVKEKLLAAHRLAIKTVILPKDNEKDLQDIPKEVLANLSVNLVETMDEVLRIALERPVAPQTACLEEITPSHKENLPETPITH